MMINQTLNHNCVNSAGVRDKGPAHGSVSVNPEHCQNIAKQSGNYSHDLFRLGSWNVLVPFYLFIYFNFFFPRINNIKIYKNEK